MVVYRNLCPTTSLTKIINPQTNNPPSIILSDCPRNLQFHGKIRCFGSSRHPTISMETSFALIINIKKYNNRDPHPKNKVNLKLK